MKLVFTAKKEDDKFRPIVEIDDGTTLRGKYLFDTEDQAVEFSKQWTKEIIDKSGMSYSWHEEQ